MSETEFIEATTEIKSVILAAVDRWMMFKGLVYDEAQFLRETSANLTQMAQEFLLYGVPEERQRAFSFATPFIAAS